jgi:hypothetical protein
VAEIFSQLLGSTTPETANTSFADVSGDAWYASAVHTLARQNVLIGYADNTFKPEQSITRAELVTIAARFNQREDTFDNPFTDLSISHWAYEHIVSAYGNGWVRGFTDGEFKPEHIVTRAEAITIVNRMLGRILLKHDAPESLLNIYPDLSESHWAIADLIEASISHAFTRNDDASEHWTDWQS